MKGGGVMFLPKPNAISVPSNASPIGVGLNGCNSGNKCDSQTCDQQSGGNDSCGWSLVGIIISFGLASF